FRAGRRWGGSAPTLFTPARDNQPGGERHQRPNGQYDDGVHVLVVAEVNGITNRRDRCPRGKPVGEESERLREQWRRDGAARGGVAVDDEEQPRRHERPPAYEDGHQQGEG